MWKPLDCEWNFGFTSRFGFILFTFYIYIKLHTYITVTYEVIILIVIIIFHNSPPKLFNFNSLKLLRCYYLNSSHIFFGPFIKKNHKELKIFHNGNLLRCLVFVFFDLFDDFFQNFWLDLVRFQLFFKLSAFHPTLTPYVSVERFEDSK